MNFKNAFHRHQERLLYLALTVVLCCFSLSCFAIEKESYLRTNEKLVQRGKQFRAEVDSTFLKMSKENAMRSYDLIQVCQKYIPAGTSFKDVEVILHAAGQNGSMVPDYNHLLPPDSPDRSDVGGGFLLHKSWISNSIFLITFRPDIAQVTNKKVKQIMSCGVLTNSLWKKIQNAKLHHFRNTHTSWAAHLWENCIPSDIGLHHSNRFVLHFCRPCSGEYQYKSGTSGKSSTSGRTEIF